MKKIIKIMTILIVFIFILNNFSIAALTPSDFENPDTSYSGDIESVGGSMLNILSIIASAISIIAIIALGIKYMMGSAEERAEYKKTLLPYFIGAVFVFGATTIPSIIYNMVK